MERGLDQRLFDLLGRQLQGHGVIVKQGAIVDASIITSSRRSKKVEVVEAREEGAGCAKVKLEFLLNAMAFNLKKAALMVG